jgi:DNA polymerase-3 subunit delta
MSPACGRLASIMASPRAADILGHVTLVTGPEEFLNQRTVIGAIRAVQQAEPESEVSETTADLLSMAALGDLAAPSLFSSIRCVVVRGLEDLPDDAYDGLIE